MKKVLLLIISILISSIINKLFLDSLLDVFHIMSNFSLVANRVALTLFIYFSIDLFFIESNFKIKSITNKLFFIYLIWLIGLLFGRFNNISNYNMNHHFNFTSFLPEWIHHLDNPLVCYYIFGNILVYIPFGLFLRYHKNLLYSILYFILIILLLETLQGVTNFGYFDIDDIFLNGIGGLIGIFIMHIISVYRK